MFQFTDSDDTDEECEFDNFIVPVLSRNNLFSACSNPQSLQNPSNYLCSPENSYNPNNGTPESFQNGFLETEAFENETASQGQDSTAPQQASSHINPLELSTESKQVEKVAERQTYYPSSKNKCKKKVNKDPFEERTKSVYYPFSNKTCSKTVEEDTHEETGVCYEFIEQGQLTEGQVYYPCANKKRVKVETPEQQEMRLRKYQERMEIAKQDYLAKMENETPEERAIRLEKVKNWRIVREAKRSEADKNRIREQRRKRRKFRIANETPEEREKRLAWFNAYQRSRPRKAKKLTEAQKKAKLEHKKMRYALTRATETPEQRAERLAKARAKAKKKKRRALSPESLERINERRRENYRKRKLLKAQKTTEQKNKKLSANWEVKIEAVQSAQVPTDHSLHLEVKVEPPENLDETLYTYVEEGINPMGSDMSHWSYPGFKH